MRLFRLAKLSIHKKSLLIGLVFSLFSFSLLANENIKAEGSFTVVIDWPTLTLKDVGTDCRLVVNGGLNLSGTLEGVAEGLLTALVDATCLEVASAPPGIYSDVFRADLVFSGTVNNQPKVSQLIYEGVTEVGGEINGRLILNDKSKLDVEAVIAVGGTYKGKLKL